MPPFELPGLLRRIRRIADLSQRELAAAVEVSKSLVAAVETGRSGLDVRVVARAAALAGLRLLLVDAAGDEIEPMSDDVVRDMSRRRFPAHLDTRYTDQGWWHDAHRYSRARLWYTFDRDREHRDRIRNRRGTPADHQVPRAGDSPQERAEARRRAHWLHVAEERERAFLAGELRLLGVPFECSCPASCDDLDDRSGRPVHAPECSCGCDVA